MPCQAFPEALNTSKSAFCHTSTEAANELTSNSDTHIIAIMLSSRMNDQLEKIWSDKMVPQHRSASPNVNDKRASQTYLYALRRPLLSCFREV
jgi:hypothetical protein